MFLQAEFGLQSRLPTQAQQQNNWQDFSEREFYVFRSVFGTVRLRKRANYPTTYAIVDHNILMIGYGNMELAREMLGQDSPLLPYDPNYLQEFLYIEIDCIKREVRLQRDGFCTVPLFAAYDSEYLAIANSFEATCEVFGGDLVVDRQKLYNLVIDRRIDSNDTCIENCIVLEELERLTWRKGKLHRSSIAGPIEVAAGEYGSDPLIFRKFLDSLMGEYAERYVRSGSVGCEFSGGVDSAIIAGHLADNGYDPLLVSMGFPGEYGKSQQEKIRNFRDRFNTRHHVVDMDVDTLFPLSELALHEAWRPVYEQQELYYACANECRKLLSENNIDVVFNGLGGDDVLARFDFLRPSGKDNLPNFYNDDFKRDGESGLDNDPADYYPYWSNQFLWQKLGRNNTYIDHNIWPVMPYADPRLFHYCQELRPRFRDNKNIFRMYCEAWRYPVSIYNAEVNENFAPFFNECADKYFKPMALKWLEHSGLARLGIIDREAALEYVDRAQSQDEYAQIHTLMLLEINTQLLNLSIK